MMFDIYYSVTWSFVASVFDNYANTSLLSDRSFSRNLCRIFMNLLGEGDFNEANQQ